MSDSTDIVVRAIDAHDLEQVVPFVEFQRAHGTPRHEAEALQRWIPSVHAALLLVVEDEDDELVGCGQASILTPSESNVMMVNLFNLPGRVDVLRALLDRMLAWTEAERVATVYAHVMDPPAHAGPDLEATGFRFGNVRSRVERPITPADRGISLPEIDGVTLTSMAEHPELDEQLLAMWNEGLADVPGEMSFPDSDMATLRKHLEAPAGDPWPDRIRIAVSDDGELLALCALLPFPGTTTYGHRLTTARRDQRGKGLARAVKLDAIRWAARDGATLLRASNDSDNAPMIAINDSLGYETTNSIEIYVLDVDR